MPLSNSQYAAIMREYEATRYNNKKEEKRRRQEVYDKIPSYEQLDLAVPDITAAFRHQDANGVTASLQEIRKKISDISAQKKALLTSNGFPEDYLSGVYTCKDCQDTGVHDGKRCHCYYEKTKQLHYTESHLTELLQSNNFDVLREYQSADDDKIRFRQVVNTCKSYVSSFQNRKDASGILFYGPVGTGKTFLSLAIAKEILDLGYSVMYFSAINFFNKAAAVSFHSGDEAQKETFFNEIFDCDLLIIDDLGTEMDTKATPTILFNLINERFLRHTSTLISTNLDLKKLYERYSDRIFSRLNQYIQCELTGDDVRFLKLKADRTGMP